MDSRLGTTVHDELERVWRNDYKTALTNLGMSENMIDKIAINPKKETSNMLPVYLEQRVIKELNGWKIGGKYDLIFDGKLIDYKITKSWAWIFNKGNSDYIMQGNIYKWLNPDKITEPTAEIHYLFKDWTASKIKEGTDYPDSPAKSYEYPLLHPDYTEELLVQKLKLLESHLDSSQDNLPDCTKEELKQKDSVFAYYKNPEGKRSTANFDTYMEAANRKAADGNKGRIEERKGKAIACSWCNARSICKQSMDLEYQGLLD